ncbi:MAG: DUF4294 domain-containing protein [Flavobacteriaceae bacterium]
MNRVIIFLVILISFSAYSQKKVTNTKGKEMILFEGDSIEFSLDEIHLLKKMKFDNKKEQRYYYWYWKKIHKAYPYAVMTAKKIEEVELALTKIKSKRKRKRYIKKAQKSLKKEFKGKLKKLTRTEGKLLVRLIHRQTGKTAFTWIKKYRKGFKAFWYDTTANVFKISLKKEYNPIDKQLDFLVEHILQHAFLNNTLIESKSKLKFDFDTLSSKHKRLDIVELIKNR